VWSPEKRPGIIKRMAEIWRDSKNEDVKYVACWGISSLSIIPRNQSTFNVDDTKMIDFIKDQAMNIECLRNNCQLSPFILGYYIKQPWDDNTLAELLSRLLDNRDLENNVMVMLSQLGEIGKQKLIQHEEKQMSIRTKRKLRPKTR